MLILKLNSQSPDLAITNELKNGIHSLDFSHTYTLGIIFKYTAPGIGKTVT